MILGAIIMTVSLFLTLFTVTFSPPGGSALVGGHHINAFQETISGWSFATTALWAHEPATSDGACAYK
jgi:hypothetical protein